MGFLLLVLAMRWGALFPLGMSMQLAKPTCHGIRLGVLAEQLHIAKLAFTLTPTHTTTLPDPRSE